MLYVSCKGCQNLCFDVVSEKLLNVPVCVHAKDWSKLKESKHEVELMKRGGHHFSFGHVSFHSVPMTTDLVFNPACHVWIDCDRIYLNELEWTYCDWFAIDTSTFQLNIAVTWQQPFREGIRSFIVCSNVSYSYHACSQQPSTVVMCYRQVLLFSVDPTIVVFFTHLPHYHIIHTMLEHLACLWDHKTLEIEMKSFNSFQKRLHGYEFDWECASLV